ncbi:hypothetical protein SHJG_7143 [Streptomyces hygroscopicus subsp. jinggangensis 5008]|nr:hypothetical protein SHJG_7143 [Streptomyces hygroscopicus subsp. jinggangensis 5008]AGF66565.1 hypothetical protein SHJGH_6903 [Streptomyces hygroscopicus subsp. jinggangensis TL01]
MLSRPPRAGAPDRLNTAAGGTVLDAQTPFPAPVEETPG